VVQIHSPGPFVSKRYPSLLVFYPTAVGKIVDGKTSSKAHADLARGTILRIYRGLPLVEALGSALRSGSRMHDNGPSSASLFIASENL
jgi:hypothetical protein